MAVQKNFVVKNGIEVNENLIFADNTANKVGIGTTITPEKLQVNGGIGATSIVLSGVGTIPISFSNISNIGDAYIVSGVVTSITGTALTYTNADIGTLSADVGYVVSGVVTNLTGTISTITNINTTNLVGTIGTFTTVDITNLSVDNAYVISGVVTNLTGTAATIGTVEIVSGIVTATSGVVTYYGDGRYLDLSNNSSAGIGIATAGGALGYGVTFLNFFGAGVSTSFYDSSVGIATIFFQGGGGGGGGGAIGIGSTFPGTPLSIDPVPSNGDLFFHIDYGRTFIYYDEVILGVGSSAFWIDSSPFNIGIITAIYGGVSFSDGSASSPSWYFEGDSTTGVFSPVNGELTFVSTGSSVLNINSSGVIVTGVTTSTKANIGAATTFPEDLVVQGDARVTGVTTSTKANIGAATTFPEDLVVQGDARVTGITTSTKANIGAATTFPEDLVVQGDARVTGILTVGTSSIILDGNTDVITVGSGATINGSNGNAVFAGSITASSFSGDGSGLTGAGSTVADDTTTNSTFYPVFTATTTGTITASKVSTTKLTFNPSTGTLTATDLNSSSDASLKENIETIENAIDTVNDLRGVKFDWKEDGRTSYGVIAQELENVLPELVSSGELKTVNYNGIIGVLIEAVKELSAEVEDLKNKLS